MLNDEIFLFCCQRKMINLELDYFTVGNLFVFAQLLYSLQVHHIIFFKKFTLISKLFTIFICCLLPLVCFLPCAFIICKLLKHIGILFPSLSNLLRWNITFFFVAIISLYCITTFYVKKGNGGHLRVYVD